MDPARWKRVEEIYHAASERKPEEWVAFLVGACGGDEELRHEVESLLAQPSAKGLFDRPAWKSEAGDGDTPSDTTRPAIGQRIAHYEIQAKLGEGGMGAVYRAYDTQLRRPVALKILLPEYASDPERRSRLLREARAASALNHPNIVSIHEVGSDSGVDFFAMELVEGKSLDKMIPAKGLPLREALDYAVQIVSGLSKAHAAGVIHRDLKPGNIMLSRDGLVKLLDFGLARRVELGPGHDTTLTIEGQILGTPSYMSPEQAQGKPLDVRSDVFSFGSVLYEMVTGERPFEKGSHVATMAAVVEEEPRALPSSVPRDLERIILRCMRKDSARRFQSMLEVKIGLEDLRGPLLDGAGSAMSPRPIALKKWGWVARTITAFAVCCAVAGTWLLLERKSHHSENNGPLEITRLTNEGGLNIDPAISPDGKLLTYASDRGGDTNLDIWVKQIGGTDAIRVTRDRADDVEPNFSPDGTKIVFRSAGEGGGLYLIPTLGGMEQRLADSGRRPQFSPDGSQIAYWTGPDDPFPLRKGMGQMFVFDLATSTTRQLREDFAAAVHPVWSPDGKSVLFIGLRDAADVLHTYDWWITPVTGGTAARCHMFNGSGFSDPFAWRDDRVYFSGEMLNWAGPRTGVVTIDPRTWQAVGEPRPLAAGTTHENSPSLSKDGGRLVFASLTGNPALYELPIEADHGKASGAIRRLTSDEAQNTARSISADGKRMAFVSTRSGSEEIWAKDLATGLERELTFGGTEKWFPLITRDGELVAWKMNDIGDHRTFATPFAGGAPAQICADCGAPDAWSGDRKFLLFNQRKSGRLFEGLLEVATGSRSEYMQDPQLGLRVSSISYDGKWIAFEAYRTDRDFAMYVAPFSPVRPPPPSEWVRIPHSAEAHPNPCWSPDGNMLYFSSEQDGYACIWAERLDPVTKHPRGEPLAVQHFHSTSLKMVAPSFGDPIALAFDKIVLSLESRSGEIWMLKLHD